MRIRFLSFWMMFLLASLVMGTFSTSGQAGVASANPATVSTCSHTAEPQFVMPAASKPMPQPEVVCLKEICKMDHGVLYYCVAHVTQNCCRYNTSQDCAVDPNCTFSVPAYCPNDPPNACNNTCTG
jgi:hypothetical protein